VSDWFAGIDPVALERERFNIPNVGVLRNREGTQLGELHRKPDRVNVTVLRALTKERDREGQEQHRAVVRGELRGRIRHLEMQLARERREHERALEWERKVSSWGHRNGGPSSLRGTA